MKNRLVPLSSFVPVGPAAALRRLAMGVVIVGDGILKRIKIEI